MPFFDEKSGILTLGNGVRLLPRMPLAKVSEALRAAGGTLPADPGDVLFFPACDVAGGQLAPVAFLADDRLCAIHLWVVSVGAREIATAEQQRAFLFSLFRCTDPSPDTLKTCRLNCDFGQVTLSTDPRNGCGRARLSYQPAPADA